MERRIDLSNLDLDAAATAIIERQPTWAALGLNPKPLTWVDNEEAWPQQLRHDRAKVARPMSLGLQINGHDGEEAEFALYAGGWADSQILVDGEIVPSHLELEAIDEFIAAVDAAVTALARRDL